jgi:hypothetical protein
MSLAAATEGKRQLCMTSNRFNPAENLLRRYAVVLKCRLCTHRDLTFCGWLPPSLRSQGQSCSRQHVTLRLSAQASSTTISP